MIYLIQVDNKYLFEYETLWESDVKKTQRGQKIKNINNFYPIAVMFYFGTTFNNSASIDLLYIFLNWRQQSFSIVIYIDRYEDLMGNVWEEGRLQQKQ